MLWFFARLARTQGGGPALLDAAALGYRFLRDRLWDDEHGGFYWAVAADGGAVPMPDKHLYGQAFALYALSEYFLASGQAEALDLAHRLFDVLEARAHDDHHGGYHQFFRRDWSPPAPDVPSYRGAPGLKSLDTHLHLLEALTTYTQATGRVAAQRRLTELILIQSSAVVRKEGPVCTEAYEPDWTPRLEGAHGRVLYGHLLQNAWLLLEACDVAGLPSAPLVDLCGALFAAAVRAGYDEPRGGFYVSGPLRGPADERAKVWWVQAEALASALRLYQATQHAAYFAIFEKTWEFVRRYQIDWTHGEWHATLSPSGGSSGAKGSNWKTAYHNGRALMNCLAWLRALA